MKNLTLIALSVFLLGQGIAMADNDEKPKECTDNHKSCPEGTSCIQSLESDSLWLCLKSCNTVADCPTTMGGHHECLNGYCHRLP